MKNTPLFSKEPLKKGNLLIEERYILQIREEEKKRSGGWKKSRLEFIDNTETVRNVILKDVRYSEVIMVSSLINPFLKRNECNKRG
jgi:hypothetical protein